jgi:hypothetical protein
MRYFYLVIASLFLICCKSEEGLMWLNRYPVEEYGNIMSEQIPCFDIRKKYRNVYIKILNERKYAILSNDDYYLLTAKMLKKKYGLAIRGIYTDHSGFFEVYKNSKKELYVMFFPNEIDEINKISFYKKAVLIIEVDELPEDIYNGLPNRDGLMWVNRYPVEKSGNIMSEKIPCFDIKKEYRNVYIKILNERKYVILSNDDYHLLTYKMLKKKYGLAIRGVYTDHSGFFDVYENFKNELYVVFSPNKDERPLFYKKAVLIVEVDELPEDIYNDLSYGAD